MRRLTALAALIGVCLLVWSAPVSAHPLGNFTVNVYTGVVVQPERLLIDLVVDMAEIPTFQTRRTIDGDGDGQVGDAESRAYAAAACADSTRRIEVTVSDRRAVLRSEEAEMTFPPGTAGLATLRLTCSLVADVGEIRREQRMVVRNRAYDDRVGWREMAAVGDRTTLVASDVGRRSISDRLVTYPDDLLQSPPDQRVATLSVRPGGPPAPPEFAPDQPSAAGASRGIDRVTRSFTELVGRQRLTPAFGALALLLSVVLGAAHAVAPGHGKTVMAAYVVGRHGSIRQAVLIGATVTLTHTAGVLALGLVLSASTSLAPESLYPWLGMASGILLVAIGAALLFRAIRRHVRMSPASPAVAAHQGAHGHLHRHEPDGPSHSHGPRPNDDGAIGWRGLVAVGVAGGLVPTPSALVVLLGAIALGRAWFGVALVTGYGIGMAATLTAIGLLLVWFRESIDKRLSRHRRGRFLMLKRALPALTAALIVGVGVLLTTQAAIQL